MQTLLPQFMLGSGQCLSHHESIAPHITKSSMTAMRTGQPNDENNRTG
jgi:hypothetical protein